jgi:thioredoxin 1
MKKPIFFTMFFLFALQIFAKPIDIESIETFENALKQENKLLIFDMYADWCRPCKLLDPILTEISNENQKVQFYRINIDKQREIAAAFGIRNIPLVLFFKNGKFIDGLLGLHSKETYVKAIEILDK